MQLPTTIEVKMVRKTVTMTLRILHQSMLLLHRQRGRKDREEKKAIIAAKKQVAEKRAKRKETKISNEDATASTEKEKLRNEEETIHNESEGFEDEHEDMTLRDWVDMNNVNFAKKMDENRGKEGMQTKCTSGVNVNDMDLGATEEGEDVADDLRDDFSFDTRLGGQENETNFVDQDGDGTEGAGELDQMERNEKATTKADEAERNEEAATKADEAERNKKATTEADANFMDQILKNIIEEIVNEAERN